MDLDLMLAAASTLLLILAAMVLGLIFTEVFWYLHCRDALKRCQADERARALLRAWLSSTQLAQYDRTGTFEVVGSHSGTRYRIRAGQQRRGRRYRTSIDGFSE